MQQFILNGFVRLEHAFPRALADDCRELLWRDTGCDPDDPGTWKQPVIRLGDYPQEPFREAANTPTLHAAFDQLPGTVNFDFSAFKSFFVTETKKVEFRSEWFNAFNHAQFLNPASAVNTGTTARLLNAKPSRQIQMVLKFIF